MPTKTAEKDWVTPVVVVAGLGLAVAGGYMLFHKKNSIKPGGTYEITFAYEYQGPAASYLLRVVMGNIIAWVFNEDESTRQEFPIQLPTTPSWKKYTSKVNYEVPEIIGNLHDIEFSIRYPNGNIVSGVRVLTDNVVEPGV